MPGHPQVGDDDVEGELIEELEGLLAVLRLDDVEAVARQALGHQTAQNRLVVNEKEVRCLGTQGANILTHSTEAGPDESS